MDKIKKRGGWTPKTTEERKVQVFGYVKGKHYLQAQKEVSELLKKYR